ncbi:MAG: hypothetical protein ACRC6B_08115 [Fusobacteriaceae bacterium]
MITAANRNAARTSINNERKCIGQAAVMSDVAAGSSMTASDTNSLLSYVRALKTSIGTTTSIQADVAAGAAIKDVYSHITAAVASIHNNCGCHGNCSGKCAGTCTTTCGGTCGCGGCGACSCNCGGCGASGNKRISPTSPYYRFEIRDFLDEKTMEVINKCKLITQ